MSSNVVYTGTGPDTIDLLNRPIGRAYASVQDNIIEISLDGGNNFFHLSVGLHKIDIGFVRKIRIRGEGIWQILIYYYS